MDVKCTWIVATLSYNPYVSLEIIIVNYFPFLAGVGELLFLLHRCAHD